MNFPSDALGQEFGVSPLKPIGRLHAEVVLAISALRRDRHFPATPPPDVRLSLRPGHRVGATALGSL